MRTEILILIKMRASMRIEIIQWTWILSVGFIASTRDFSEDIYKVVVTIVSMVLGAVASHFVKLWLNRKK